MTKNNSMRTCCRFPLLLPPVLVRPRPVPFRPTLGTLCNHKAKAGEGVRERRRAARSHPVTYRLALIIYIIIKGAWGGGSVVSSSRRRQGANIGTSQFQSM